uniref:Reverse transcriptase domain, reverse transcriptase zinc-binding domain protein n=1 Tax=Tanacetum cinerariifolium TaxID=118510 RepID=A0A6L2K0U8_TANCI|nr:reverse transcriptase domain, reverse transcriptase zinc-binding domain protein [Tanacetum cinerariifolium]
MINGLMVDGTWITDPNLIKDAFLQFYEVKFQGQYDHVVFPNLPCSLTLDNRDQDNLERQVNNPTCITYFRHISLINIHYKTIAKILANRLAKVIDKIISKEQSAFIAARQILDGPLILTEIIEWYKIRKKNLLIFKVDFEKAFDSISWKFLDHILVKLGFGQKWCSWIKACLISSRASILVNGSPTFEFSINRGLRQGDPLSPFLFILIMEGLYNALADAVTKGLISGVTLNNSNISISHLFYADDVIITSQWNARELENIIRVLHIFYLASGLKINIHKSNIYGIGVNDEDVSSMAHNVGCISGAPPITYLGFPIGSNMNSIASWNMFIDRFQSRLSSWKYNLLSFGGRLTLIKSVLRSLGIYYFSIYRAPQTVLRDLERIRSNLFWGVKNLLTLLYFKNGVEGCSHPQILYGLRLLKHFMVKKVALILMVVNSRVPGQILLVRRTSFIRKVLSLLILLNLKHVVDPEFDFGKTYKIKNGNWNWNWSITNLGSRNISYLRDMLNEIGDVNIEVVEDTCYWSLGSNGIYTAKEARQIIDLRLSPRLIFNLLGTKCYLEKLISFCGECL